MTVFLILGIVWTLYGIAGLCGFQRIAEKYKHQTWTRQYVRDCGISWLILGIPWILFYAVGVSCTMHWLVVVAVVLTVSVPSVVYSMMIEKKYSAKRLEGGEQTDSNCRTENEEA